MQDHVYVSDRGCVMMVWAGSLPRARRLQYSVGTSGARFSVVFDIDWKSGPIVLHVDLMKSLRLTKMTCKRMVMQVLENSGRLLEFRT